ncbi:FtsJ methyltransferase domain-containing protein 2 [Haplosporangium sp. Z 27]|nr:FtsJ methyltransferase domain-containing protein 2 [Haplosporangium sp. Z 27]
MDPYNNDDPAFKATPLESPTEIPTIYNCPRSRFQQPGPIRGGHAGFTNNNQRPPFQYQQGGVALRYDPQHGLQPQGYSLQGRGHIGNNPHQQQEQQSQLMRPLVPPTEFLDQHLDVFQASSYELPENCFKIEYGPPEKVDLDLLCIKGIVDNLVDSKAKLRAVPQEIFGRARQRCNPYELVGSSIFINRASVKLASIDSQLALTANKEDPTGSQGQGEDAQIFRFADLCSGPGGFSEYLLWRKHTWGERARGWAMTLKGDLDFQLERFHKDTLANENLKVFYGKDGTGDILRQENIDAFAELVEQETKGLGVGLVSADGGISVDGDEAVQETLLQRLILCQILAMFMTLQKGGDFVVKVFDIFTPVTAGLVWILSRHFEKICVVKPLTSRPMNSERYVVCRHLLRSKPSLTIEHLKNINARYQQIEEKAAADSTGVKKEDVNHIMDFNILKGDTHFMDYIKRNNMKSAIRQTEALDVFLKYVNEGLRPAFDQEAIKRLCLQEWRIPPRPQPIHSHQQQQQHHHHHQSHQQQRYPSHGHQHQHQQYPNHLGSGQRHHPYQSSRPHQHNHQQHGPPTRGRPYSNSQAPPAHYQGSPGADGNQRQKGVGMASQHSDKRIKLFLERSIERLPFDITQKAEEIYLPDGDPSEKLKRKIKTITEIAGDQYDQFTDNVTTITEKKQQEDSTTLETGDQDSKTIPEKEEEVTTAVTTTSAAANTRITSPQGIYAKLWHAQSEIGLALDVLNIIISSYQSNSGSASGLGGAGGPMTTPPTALPPGSLKCEYVPRAPLSLSTQISNEKMALGGKKHQLRNAADILMQGAQKLKKVMADESQFWEGALRLRKNNWCIVSSRLGHHVNRLASGSQLFVQYGFQDVGSLHGSRSYAELVRNQSSSDSVKGKSKSMELNIPNKSGKIVIMSLVQQGASHTNGSRTINFRKHNTIHSQLLDAQDTLFDAELFHELMNEARSMNNSVYIVDNEIFLPINDELELKIAYRTPTAKEQSSLSSSQSNSLLSSQGTISGTSFHQADNPDLSKSLEGTADILRCAMQLMQHRRYRQNIKERSDSFFKSSRPGGGRTAGSFGQIQQAIQQRPTAVLNMTLQALQYYSFSKRIREVLGKVTRNLKQSWWEPIRVHSIDVKAPPPTYGSSVERNAAATTAPGTALASLRSAPSYGMGSAVSVHLGAKAAAVRFVMRSHPAPCVVLQSSDRPSSPIMHVAEFERALEQELAIRAIGRICEVVNSIQVWNEALPGLQSPEFVVDIDRRCVGVFQIPQKNGTSGSKTAHVILELDMKSERAICISLACKQGGNTRHSRIFLEDQQIQEFQNNDESNNTVHPYDMANTLTATVRTAGRTMEGFRAWLRQNIMAELDI